LVAQLLAGWAGVVEVVVEVATAGFGVPLLQGLDVEVMLGLLVDWVVR
jgi:hypothetical protein